MTNLAMLMFFAASLQDPGTGPANRDLMRDQAGGPTPVTDLFLLPPKIPDCRTQEAVDQALKAKRNMEAQQCDPDRFVRAHGN